MNQVRLLGLTASLFSVGCASKAIHPQGLASTLVMQEGVRVDGGDLVLHGLRLADVGVDAATASRLDALGQSCPQFAERLLWVECSAAPCLVTLWGQHTDRADQPTAWEQVTCGLDTEAVNVGYHASGGADHLLGRTVFALTASDGFDRATVADRAMREFEHMDAAVEALALARLAARDAGAM